MKTYCLLLIDKITNKIEHCISSDNPVNKNMAPVIQPSLKTIPPSPPKNFREVFIEFEAADGMCRARECINNLEVTESSVKFKKTADQSRLMKLKETTESKMKSDYRKLK